MTDREKQLVAALRDAWHMLNAIRACEGVPYHRYDGMPYCTDGSFSDLVDECHAAIEAITGEPPKPWPFAWESESFGQTTEGPDPSQVERS